MYERISEYIVWEGRGEGFPDLANSFGLDFDEAKAERDRIRSSGGAAWIEVIYEGEA